MGLAGAAGLFMSIIAHDADTTEALSKMRRTNSGRLMVVDRDRLLGIVSLKDMMAFLSLKIELES